MNFSQIIRSILDYLLIVPVSLLPQHFLSRQIHKLTRIQLVRIKHLLIQGFCKLYAVNVAEAQRDHIREYVSFNDFFTRSLKSGSRPICKQQLASPVDGTVSQHGAIKIDLLYQAKNFYFTLQSLLGNEIGENLATEFTSGQFATLYLSPKDYHRIHMPCAGKLIYTVYIPGRLYPVNGASVRTVPNVFARNERLVCMFDTEYGKMAMVLVGAIFVGSIETIWQGEVTPPTLKNEVVETYDDIKTSFAKGEEMARFNMGSTVIILLADEFAKLDLTIAQKLKLGTAITNI